ncbi:hypothetical protein Nizo3892_2102 [Lactiplantibacillus plantarum]|nr:hypothetical protein Nizo3892_2102 [Lactiplantibacillus plantarum]
MDRLFGLTDLNCYQVLLSGSGEKIIKRQVHHILTVITVLGC